MPKIFIVSRPGAIALCLDGKLHKVGISTEEHRTVTHLVINVVIVLIPLDIGNFIVILVVDPSDCFGAVVYFSARFSAGYVDVHFCYFICNLKRGCWDRGAEDHGNNHNKCNGKCQNSFCFHLFSPFVFFG